MRTNSIGHRVADFLQRYPPFQYVAEEVLLELAQGGRVQFHESDEIVFQQGQSRKRFIYVIQQGVVRLIQETEHGELLRDLRGEGDLLGIGRFAGDTRHRFTARTDSDVILYALPADSFSAMADRHPRVAQFLSANFSVVAGCSRPNDHRDSGAELRLGTRPADWMGQTVPGLKEPITCSADTLVRDIARTLASRQGRAAVVLEPGGTPIGLITPRSLSDRVATGDIPPNSPVDRIMLAPPPVAPTGLEAGEYLIRMLRSECDLIALTRKGRTDTPVVGIVSSDDLELSDGAILVTIRDAMVRAPDDGSLLALYAKAEGFLAGGLTDPPSLRRLAPVANAIKSVFLRRVVTLTEERLAFEGQPSPEARRCWVYFGATARNELLTRSPLDYGLIYETPSADSNGEAHRYFSELIRGVDRAMSGCGFFPADSRDDPDLPTCLSLAEWRHAFTRWIRDPVESRIYRATSFFDFSPAFGDDSLAEELFRHIDAEENANPNFVRLLANDSMENLPPLTFFRGLVVDEEGAEFETLDLKRATLDPVVDIARTLALDGASRRISTLERLRDAKEFFRDDEQLLAECSAAFANALYCRARTGLVNGTEGNRIDPEKLSRYEQTLLKSGFRTVLRLMEHAGQRYGLLPE